MYIITYCVMSCMYKTCSVCSLQQLIRSPQCGTALSRSGKQRGRPKKIVAGCNGCPMSSTEGNGYSVSNGRPMGTTLAAGYCASDGCPVGTTLAAGYSASDGRPLLADG